MRRVMVLAICALSILFLYEAYGILESARIIISSGGSIFIPPIFYVKPFGFRIADMMADILLPHFDSYWYSVYWQEALDDLAAASPNGEITHAQMRIWWRIDTGEETTAEDWINPQLGSKGGFQNDIMTDEKWKRWYFGYVEPGDLPLAYGPCAFERIREKGFKYEFAISGAWENGDVVKPEPASHYYKEADFPEWMALGGGDTFLENYKNNVVLPVANFVKDYLEDGDIFCIGFETSHIGSDFTWSHNEKWIELINEVRNVFTNAGKSILLTIDHCGWWDDITLGYNAVKLLKPDAPIPPEWQGISGATYLGELDFISVSIWLPMLLSEEVPAVWSDDDIPMVVDEGWYNCKREPKVGTGYGGIPAELGRNYIQDLWALSQVMGKKVLMNTGYYNTHGWLAWETRNNHVDNMEQRVAWAAQLAAIRDPRSNFTAWCAGQDFERYCRDKAEQPDYKDTSWRKAPAEAAIIDGIRAIVSAP